MIFNMFYFLHVKTYGKNKNMTYLKYKLQVIFKNACKYEDVNIGVRNIVYCIPYKYMCIDI